MTDGAGSQAGEAIAADDPETRARRRGAVLIGALLAVGGAMAAIATRREDPTAAVLCAVSSAVHAAAALEARRARRVALPMALIGVDLFATLALTGLFGREGPSAVLDSPTLVFFAIGPPVTMYLVGVRGALAALAGTMAYFAAIFAALSRHPPAAPDPDLTSKYVSANVAMVVSFAMSWLYTRAQTRMMAELEATRDALDAVHGTERRRLREELDLAARIQTALQPRDLYVEGLEITAAMLPAAEVGGDYYDVIPVAGGAWLCIGDVAGHGLNAGLTMLMIQSAVSALAQRDPTPGPGRVLAALNTTLYQNVRRRMARDEHATLTLLRYFRDGTVCFAGAHEEILVLRAAEGRCEVIATPGPWVGARSSLAGRVTESRLALCDGDVLVLYTDGLTEARSGSREQFGIERVEGAMLRARGEPVEAIRDAILEAVHAHCPALADDIALLVARYHAPAPR